MSLRKSVGPVGWARRAALIVVGAACIASSTASAGLAALANGSQQATTSQPLPPVRFPPGGWRGVAVISGQIQMAEVDVQFTEPAVLTFDVDISANGSVSASSWSLSGGQIVAAVPNGEGAVALEGAGDLVGDAARLELAGEVVLTGTVSVNGQGYPLDLAVVARGGFSAATATCNFVTGDVAVEMRAAQQAAGMTTSITGPFTAYPLTGEGFGPDIEEAYVALVDNAASLSDQMIVSRSDVVGLAQQFEAFYASAYSSPCGDAAAPAQMPNSELTRLVLDVIARGLNTVEFSLNLDELRLITRVMRLLDLGSAGQWPSAALGDLHVVARQAFGNQLFLFVQNELAEPTPEKCAQTVTLVTQEWPGDEYLLIPIAQICGDTVL